MEDTTRSIDSEPATSGAEGVDTSTPQVDPVPGLDSEPPIYEEHDRSSARVVALANQKGGVGKTTTVINLGAALAELGEKVLIVDFDPQGGCALGLGIEPSGLDVSVYNALLDRSFDVEEVILKTSVPNVELLPSNIDLAAAELMLVQEVAREQTLMRLLAPLRLN